MKGWSVICLVIGLTDEERKDLIVIDNVNLGQFTSGIPIMFQSEVRTTHFV